MKGFSITLSVSSLNMFMQCPFSWYCRYMLHMKYPQNLAMFTGSCVHSFIAYWIHRPTKDGRFSFYKTPESGAKAFFRYYHEEISKYPELKKTISKGEIDKLSGYGMKCIKNYIQQNIGNPVPEEIEVRYTIQRAFDLPVTLIGVIDQVRSIPIHKIEKYHPGITDSISEPVLDSHYSPVMLVDLKTQPDGYGSDELGDSEKAKKQVELHLNLQATVYTYMHQKMTGKLPVGFGWYQLSQGKLWPTYRTEDDFGILKANICDFINTRENAVTHEEYPRHPDKYRCSHCPYAEYCTGGLRIVDPTPMFEGSIVETLPQPPKKGYVQKKFRF